MTITNDQPSAFSGAEAGPTDHEAQVAQVSSEDLPGRVLTALLYIIGIPKFLPLDNVGLAATSAGWLLLLLSKPGGVAQALAGARDRLFDAAARRAGLDPEVERNRTAGGGVGTAGASIAAVAAKKRAPK